MKWNDEEQLIHCKKKNKTEAKRKEMEENVKWSDQQQQWQQSQCDYYMYVQLHFIIINHK